MSTGKSLGGIRICAVAALAVLSSMALPNDPQMCLYSVGPGETDSLTVEKTNTQPGYWYDIQGNLTVAKGGSLDGGNATTNWIHGVSAQKPAQVVLLSGGALNSPWNGVLAFDGYLAQPVISATPGWDNCWLYVMVVLPTAHPVNADGTASPTNELVRFNSRAYEGFFACQKLENGSPIPVVLSSTGSDSTQETPTGVYLVSGGNVGVPGVENEIVLRSTVTAHGKSYPFTYYLRGADAMKQTVDFPRVNDLGKVTVDGSAGLRVWNLNESNFGTVRFNAAYDSGRMAWATTGVCDFRNAIVRPTVDDALPYADDHVVTIRVSRDVRFDWTQVAASDSERMNGFLDVNGRTCNVGKVIAQNGAIVTDLSGNGGRLIFGANGLESGFSGTTTAGVVLEKTGPARMRLGDGSEIDTLVVAAGATGALVPDGEAALVRVNTFRIAEEDLPAGCHTYADRPDVIAPGLSICVGDAEPPALVYWAAGAQGDWNTPGNWSSGEAPSGGEHLVFTNAATISAAQEVPISAKGLIFDVRVGPTARGDVCLDLALTGPGHVRKVGKGVLRYNRPMAYAGETAVADGMIYVEGRDVVPAGRGPVTIDRRYGTAPAINIYDMVRSFSNEVRIVGSAVNIKKPSVVMDNSGGVMYGRITSADDFTIDSGYCYGPASDIRADIDAEGKTLYVTAREYGTRFSIAGRINCSIDTQSLSKQGVAGGWPQNIDLIFAGTNTATDANLFLRHDTNTFTSAAVWAGTNIVLGCASADGKPFIDREGKRRAATLVLQGSDNLSKDATLHLGEGSRIDIAARVKISVKACFVNGVAVPDGRYTAKSLPDVIVGEGRLCVGSKQGYVIVVR